MQTPLVEAHSTATSGDEGLRGATWAMLGRLLLAPPQEDLLADLAAIETGREEGEMALAWATLALAARAAQPQAVEDEYTTLFIGLGRGEVVPYGSWYLTGYLMERPLARLRQDLTGLGYARREEVREPEDHAGALCETLALLVFDGAAAQVQRAFFEEHMVPWLPRFFQDLQQAPSARFYRAVGLFGERFIEIERRYHAMPA